MIDVTKFGAVGDGVTDDTVAIRRAYAHVAQFGGDVYFPPSGGYYKVSDIQIPSAYRWITSIFDNGLYANSIKPSKNNAFIGRTSNFAGLSGSFVYGPNAEWQQPKGATVPLVDLSLCDQVYFEGISIQGQGSAPAVMASLIEGNGCVWLTFRRCVIGSYTEYSTDISGGFGLTFDECSLGGIRIAMGMATLRRCFVHKILLPSMGAPSAGDLLVDDCLSEGLNGENFLTVDTSLGSVTDVTLRRVSMADTTGLCYMLKHINNAPAPNWVVNAKIEMCPKGNIGSGYIDPTSARNLLSVICEGSDAGRILYDVDVEGRAVKDTLYDALLKGPKDQVIVYGSRYLNPPFRVEQGT